MSTNSSNSTIDQPDHTLNNWKAIKAFIESQENCDDITQFIRDNLVDVATLTQNKMACLVKLLSQKINYDQLIIILNIIIAEQKTQSLKIKISSEWLKNNSENNIHNSPNIKYGAEINLFIEKLENLDPIDDPIDWLKQFKNPNHQVIAILYCLENNKLFKNDIFLMPLIKDISKIKLRRNISKEYEKIKKITQEKASLSSINSEQKNKKFNSECESNTIECINQTIEALKTENINQALEIFQSNTALSLSKEDKIYFIQKIFDILSFSNIKEQIVDSFLLMIEYYQNTQEILFKHDDLFEILKAFFNESKASNHLKLIQNEDEANVFFLYLKYKFPGQTISYKEFNTFYKKYELNDLIYLFFTFLYKNNISIQSKDEEILCLKKMNQLYITLLGMKVRRGYASYGVDFIQQYIDEGKIHLRAVIEDFIDRQGQLSDFYKIVNVDIQTSLIIRAIQFKLTSETLEKFDLFKHNNEWDLSYSLCLCLLVDYPIDKPSLFFLANGKQKPDFLIEKEKNPNFSVENNNKKESTPNFFQKKWNKFLVELGLKKNQESHRNEGGDSSDTFTLNLINDLDHVLNKENTLVCQVKCFKNIVKKIGWYHAKLRVDSFCQINTRALQDIANLLIVWPHRKEGGRG